MMPNASMHLKRTARMPEIPSVGTGMGHSFPIQSSLHGPAAANRKTQRKPPINAGKHNGNSTVNVIFPGVF